MGWIQNRLKVRLVYFFEIAIILALDLGVFLSAILALRFVIFLTGYLFSEDAKAVRIFEVVSQISVICGYVFYTVFHLVNYLVKRAMSVKEKSREAGWAQDWFVVRLKHFFELTTTIIFNLAVFLVSSLILFFALFFAGRVFTEETTLVQVIEIVSHISVICGYAFYTIFDLIGYLGTLTKDKC